MNRSIAPIAEPESKNLLVVRHLSNLILSGELHEEEALPPESDLCERLGVSRSVLRESMKMLAAKGLVRIRQGRGTVVTRPSADTATEAIQNYLQLNPVSLRQILEVRTPVEVEVARLAAVRRSGDHVQSLKSTIRSIKTADTIEQAIGADNEFHRILVEACGNPLYRILHRSMEAYFSHLRTETARFGTRKVATQHARILGAVESGDGEIAAAAMSDHMVATLRDLERLERAV